MAFASTLIVLFIFILTGLIILRPFLDKGKANPDPKAGVYDSLLAERERLLSAIEDLDLDLELGKISEEEHAKDRNDLLSQAAVVVKELDKYSKPKQARKPGKPADKELEEDELEKMIRERREKLKDQKTDRCSSCGEKIDPGAQFCSHCGEKQ